MSGINIASLINLLGYTVGIALYLMLLVMVLKHPAQSTRAADPVQANFYTTLSSNGLLLLTAVLGLLWNIGALVMYGLKGIGHVSSYPIVSAVAFAALGFLPAVVVHSVLHSSRKINQQVMRVIATAAYCLSGTAGALHFYEAIFLGLSPSLWPLRLLTFGYVALLAIMFVSTHRQKGWKRAIWASALAVFAVSALHLSDHGGGNTDTWYVELTGHHTSLPLVMAILYQDYRFAFADIFLKRALALFVLVVVAFGLYVGVAAPFLMPHSQAGQMDPRSVAILLGLWITTALVYPWLRRGVVTFVDSIILRRVDYARLRSDVAQLVTNLETPTEIMDAACEVLAPAISAREIRWAEISSDEEEPVDTTSSERSPAISQDQYVVLLEGSGSKGAFVYVPSAEPPYYRFEIGVLEGGRRLLSDEIAMLESIAVMIARRIDVLRVTHERCEQNLREQEINKLATEAQLRALRAQVNPHFLFNALTTIGYLVQTAPDRALETLMKLTSLLRGVLRNDGEFVTLEQELELIAAYLDIERARFEERLRVSIDVPDELLSLRLPSLLVQPLVENAIKHGITPSRFGGEVQIRARLDKASGDQIESGDILGITVSDTGVGVSEIDLVRGRRRGVGLSNIEERLRCYGGQSASLSLTSTIGSGTVAELRLPVSEQVPASVLVRSVSTFSERRGA